MGKESPKLPDPRESLGKYRDFPSPKIQFSSHKIQFSSTAFCFLQWLSAYFNGFPIFLNGFPIFLNGFPFSKKSKKIYLRWQVYKRSPFELRISCHSLPKLHNRHSLPVIATCSPRFLIATMPKSHPTHSCGAPVFPTVRQIKNLNWNIICPEYNQTAPISKSQNLTNALPCKGFVRKSRPHGRPLATWLAT